MEAKKIESIKDQIKWLEAFNEEKEANEQDGNGYGGRCEANPDKARRRECELDDMLADFLSLNGLPVDPCLDAEQVLTFLRLLEWYEAGHKPDSGYEWQEETFEEAHRIFSATYQQTGGNIYVGMLKLADHVWAVFSEDMISISRVLKESEDVMEMLEDGNTVDIFVKYAN